MGAPLTKKGPVSVTVGVFDGVHRGHQALLHEVSRDAELFPLVFTFSNNPFAVLHPADFLGPLSTLSQKLERMENFGVRGFVIIDFSSDFSKLKGRYFLSLLMERLNIRKLVFGSTHKLGLRGDTGAQEAREFCESRGIELSVVPSVRIRNHRVSSSLIRRALQRGELAWVEELLGFPYILDLRGLPWERRGGEIHIDREAIPQILPPPGKYPVKCVPYKEGADLMVDRKELIWAHPVDLPVEKIIF